MDPDPVTTVPKYNDLLLFPPIGRLLHTLYEHIGVVRCLSLRNDMLVSGGDRKKIVVWDTKVRPVITLESIVCASYSVLFPVPLQN